MSYGCPVSDLRLSWFARLKLAFGCFFRVFYDVEFASRLRRLGSGPHLREADDGSTPAPEKGVSVASVSVPSPIDSAVFELTGGLTVLGLLQREGRLVDFLEQDLTAFSDADVGAAARLMHEGCRKTLHEHGTISPIRSEPEDSAITLVEGYEPGLVKLTGKVGSKAPYHGTLRHAGWRISNFRLPTARTGHDATVLAPAEVEL